MCMRPRSEEFPRLRLSVCWANELFNELFTTGRHPQLRCMRGVTGVEGATWCHHPRPLCCAGGLSTDALVSQMGLQTALLGLESARRWWGGDAKGRSTGGGCQRALGVCRSHAHPEGVRAALGHPWWHPEAFGEWIFGLRPPPSGKPPTASRATEPHGPPRWGN